MKRKFIVLILFFIFATAFISSCHGNKKESKAREEVKSEVYQCPMKCNNATFDKPGKCPVCGMDLEKEIKV